jgi:hypothetical protein
MRNTSEQEYNIDGDIAGILHDITLKKDVSVRMINLNKRYGIEDILNWVELRYDNSLQHEIFTRVLYDYTKGFPSTSYKGRLIALWNKWKIN